MKTTSFFIFALIIFVFNSCSSPKTPKTPKNMVANFEIEGMVCEHGCKGVIEKEMRNIKGITAFDIDFEEATAEVFFDYNIITTENIITKVEEINDGIYKMNLIKEREQINAKEKLPSTESSPVSVSNYYFNLPKVTDFIVEWVKI